MIIDWWMDGRMNGWMDGWMDGWMKNMGTDNDMNLMKIYLWLVPVFSMF